LTTCPARALFRRSSSVLIPRPNLKWNMHHEWFTMFNVLPEKRGAEKDKREQVQWEKIIIYLSLTVSV
jgi:hypothetical protein